MDGDALRITEAERVELGTRASLPDEGIVLGNAAVGVDAEDLAHQAVGLLRLHPVRRVDAEPGGHGGLHEQRAVVGLNDAPARALRVEQILHAFEALVVGGDPRAGDMHVRGRALLRRIGACRQHGVREVDRAVGRKALIGLRAEHALAGREHVRRHARQRLRELAVLADDPDAAVLLGEEDAAVGQELERRAVHALRKRLDGERLDSSPASARASDRATAAAADNHPAPRSLRAAAGPAGCAGGRGTVFV